PTLVDKGYHVSEKIPLIPITDEEKIIEMIMNFQWSKDFKEGERNAYIFDLSGAFCEYGISEYTAINFIQNHINTDTSFSELECEKTIKSAYKLRVFGSKYFEDYKKKEVIISDLKHDKNEVIKKHKISEDVYN